MNGPLQARPLPTGELCGADNHGFEERLQAKVPEVRWRFIEPDIAD